MDDQRAAEPTLRDLVDRTGIDEMGRILATRLMDSIARRPTELATNPSYGWIDVIHLDDELSPDERYRVIMVALEVAKDDEGALWCIGDGPMESLVGIDASYAVKFRQARRDFAFVEAAFQVMHRDRDASGRSHGWWVET